MSKSVVPARKLSSSNAISIRIKINVQDGNPFCRSTNVHVNPQCPCRIPSQPPPPRLRSHPSRKVPKVALLTISIKQVNQPKLPQNFLLNRCSLPNKKVAHAHQLCINENGTQPTSELKKQSNNNVHIACCILVENK